MATAIPAIACLGVIGRNNNPLHITILPTTVDRTGAPVPLRTALQFSLLLSSTLDVFVSRAARHAAAASSAAAPSGSAASSFSPHHPTVSAAAPLLAQGDFGLLHAIDDRLAAYGWETNTGVRFVAVVDMRGRVLDRSLPAGARSSSASPGAGGRAASSPARGDGHGSPAATSASTSMGTPSAVAAALNTKVVGLRDGELKVVFRAMQTAYIRLLQNPFYDPDETATAPAGRRITSRRFINEMRRIGEVWVPGSVNAL